MAFCVRHGNDCHYNDVPNHPFHGSFWKNNPQLQRKNAQGYFATCLDYAHPEVRDYYLALVEETLDRYDLDGLELDFVREPYLFSANEEARGTKMLTDWLRKVHERVATAAAMRGHPIRLGVRVPSRPETAKAMGLDAVTWADEGLIDLLKKLPRRVGITYRDITAPGEPYQPPLPAIGQKAVFSMKLGPAPAKGWLYDLMIRLASPTSASTTPQKSPSTTAALGVGNSPSAYVNGIPCEFLGVVATNDDFSEISFRIPARALQETNVHEIKLVSANQKPMTIRQVEVFLRPAEK